MPKKSYKKKAYKRKTIKGTSAGAVALRSVNNLKKQIRNDTEVKLMGLDLAGFSIPTIGSVHIKHLTQCAEGTGPTQRLGRQIKALAVRVSYYMYLDTGIASFNRVRIMLVRAKKQDPAVVTWTMDEMLEDIATNPIDSEYAVVNAKGRARENFHFYYDKVHYFNNQDKLQQHGVIYVRPKVNVSYSGTLADDVSQNGIYLVMFAENGGGACKFHMCQATYYTDE